MRRTIVVALSILAAAAVVEGAALAFIAARARWQTRASERVVPRGREIAARMGCFGCHGPDGARPIPNPGSKTGDVPGWTGGTWMMTPERRRDRPSGGRMPPYRDRLSSEETDELTAVVLLAEMDSIRDDPGAGDPVAEGDASHLEADWLVVRGVTLRAWGGRHDPDRDAGGDTETQAGLGVDWTLWPGMQLRGYVRRRDGPASVPASRSDEGALEVHLYF